MKNPDETFSFFFLSLIVGNLEPKIEDLVKRINKLQQGKRFNGTQKKGLVSVVDWKKL